VTNRALPNPFPWAAEYEYSQSVLSDGQLVFTAGQGGFGDDG
jgi:enamine deaminase RidA (YjgF/YER057c/UK114 family)